MTTVLFGAGFSRAVSGLMPMTVELGNELRREDSNPDERDRIPEISTGADLERWLSRIAEAQPFLDDTLNALGQVDFLVATRTIQQVLVSRQQQVTNEPMPTWLATLARILHNSAASVITFNYDTLLEQAVTSVLTEDLFQHYSAPVQPEFRGDRMPLLYKRPRRGHFEPEYAQEPSIRLVKLHGSVDAWWVPGDETGATLGTFRPLQWGEGTRPEQWNPDLQPSGREPFIIPPVSTKSPFYRNPITRHLWRDAAQALQDERVSIVGYSVPLTDLTTANMLEHTIGRLSRNNSRQQIDVVDPYPDAVLASLASLGVPDSKIKTFDDVSRWVDDLAASAPGTYPFTVAPYGG
mgnify:CR=1 FL=1